MTVQFINPLSKAAVRLRVPYVAAKIEPSVLKTFAAKAESFVGDTFTVNYFPKIAGTPLDKSSEGCKFFGVDCWENFEAKLLNQGLLNELKSKFEWGDYPEAHHITNLPPGIFLDDFASVDIAMNNLYTIKDGVCRPSDYIQELNRNGAAKWTFFSREYFGESRLGVLSHTVGLVTHDKNLLVLDSLGERTEAQKKFHAQIKDLLSYAGYENIIFSTKVQQPLNELSCNHWTYANLESVLKRINEDRTFQIRSSKDLDKLLGEDINQILDEHMHDILGH